MKKILLFMVSLLVVIAATAQVKTDFNNTEPIGTTGKYGKVTRTSRPFVLAARDQASLLANEQTELKRNPGEAKPFQIAEPVKTDIDVVSQASWTEDGGYAYGLFSIIATDAKSISANFDKLYLPKGSELYVYSENGEMITGPVTEAENTKSGFWGSWVYKGSKLTVDVKTPSASKGDLKLHISSVGYGYKELYVSNFGFSSGCNINVVCAQGAGWEPERNSVALILNGAGSALCTGSLINNTGTVDAPYFLTANHCFDNNVAQWRFTFQAWSSTCTPSQNSAGTTFNGSVLRARHSGSDFCLLELNQQPPVNSCITYSGWSRATTAPPSGVSITHPRGDIMKIATYTTTPTAATFLSSQDWDVDWASGTVEPGSSGGPLYNNNHQIIGQVHGGTPADICTPNDHAFFGRFDKSWTGGGSNSTRLRNWLDPGTTGLTSVNTRTANRMSIVGASVICTSEVYSISNLPAGSTVTWSSTWNSAPYPTLVHNSPSSNQLTINNTYGYPSGTTLTATIVGPCMTTVLTKAIGSDYTNTAQPGTYTQEACWFHNTYNPASSGNLPASNNSPTYLRQGCMTTINLSSMAGKTVIYTGAVAPLYWEYNSVQSKLYLQLPYMSGGIPFTFKVIGNNVCHERTLLFFSIMQPYYPSRFSVYPNPVAKDVLTITAERDNGDAAQENVTEDYKAEPYSIIIISGTTGEIVGKKRILYNLEEKLDISKLPKGIYNLQITQNDKIQNLRFVKE